MYANLHVIQTTVHCRLICMIHGNIVYYIDLSSVCNKRGSSDILEYRINWEIFISCAGAAGMMIYKNVKEGQKIPEGQSNL